MTRDKIRFDDMICTVKLLFILLSLGQGVTGDLNVEGSSVNMDSKSNVICQ